MFIAAAVSPALAGVGLVDDDGELPAAVLVADLVEDERELLHGRDDDLLAALDELAQVAASARRGRPSQPTWANCLIVSRICLSRIRRSVTTMIESKTGVPSLLQADELMRQPGDGVALAAARRVLDQIALPGPLLAGVGQQLPDHIELVVAREDLVRLLLAGLLVLLLDDLGVVLDDVGQALAASGSASTGSRS